MPRLAGRRGHRCHIGHARDRAIASGPHLACSPVRTDGVGHSRGRRVRESCRPVRACDVGRGSVAAFDGRIGGSSVSVRDHRGADRKRAHRHAKPLARIHDAPFQVVEYRTGGTLRLKGGNSKDSFFGAPLAWHARRGTEREARCQERTETRGGDLGINAYITTTWPVYGLPQLLACLGPDRAALPIWQGGDSRQRACLQHRYCLARRKRGRSHFHRLSPCEGTLRVDSPTPERGKRLI